MLDVKRQMYPVRGFLKPLLATLPELIQNILMNETRHKCAPSSFPSFSPWTVRYQKLLQMPVLFMHVLLICMQETSKRSKKPQNIQNELYFCIVVNENYSDSTSSYNLWTILQKTRWAHDMRDATLLWDRQMALALPPDLGQVTAILFLIFIVHKSTLTSTRPYGFQMTAKLDPIINKFFHQVI